MKVLSVLVFALALATGLSAPNGQQYNVKDLLDSAFAYYRNYLVRQDPLNLYNITSAEFRLNQPAVDVKFSALNRKLYGFSKFSVDNEISDAKTMKAQFQFTYPLITKEFDYEIQGSVFNRTVNGKGHAKFQVKNLKVAFNDLQFVERKLFFSQEESLQIASLKELFSFDDVSVNINGLTVQGLSDQQVETYVHQQFMNYFNQYKNKLEFAYSFILKSSLNALLMGHNLQEVTQWFKQHANDKHFYEPFYMSFDDAFMF